MEDILVNPSEKVKSKIIDIFNNKLVFVQINNKIVSADYRKNSKNEVDDVLNYLFLAGYLTFRAFSIKQSEYGFFSTQTKMVSFCIPNFEIRNYLYEFVKRWKLEDKIEIKPSFPKIQSHEMKDNIITFTGTRDELREIFAP